MCFKVGGWGWKEGKEATEATKSKEGAGGKEAKEAQEEKEGKGRGEETNAAIADRSAGRKGSPRLWTLNTAEHLYTLGSTGHWEALGTGHWGIMVNTRH